MEKGFMLGAIAGAVAVTAYQVGASSKNKIDKNKKKIVQKIEELFD